ncbi:Cytochrome P450 97B2, chloroplastic [Apostasia shenzhenica]|uniref:Cytochrome P450 97B2, chloroplastic n=1 Tax=Apostasia shenzhenica TaxID=1088818 RepID=A0A2I0B1B2_9ASPA|nr:Cytochrome P450 97B2, chloroplastic [Apostasia shenzhenica]
MEAPYTSTITDCNSMILILAFVSSLSITVLALGAVYKLAFGPKSFVVVSDPIVARHILRENAFSYDKGVLADILEPIMGKGLIPADIDTWKQRRKATVRERLWEMKDSMNNLGEEVKMWLEGSNEVLKSISDALTQDLYATKAKIAKLEQLRDDLMTMLIAGHETTAAVLTWSIFLLAQSPSKMRKAQAEADSVLGGKGGYNGHQDGYEIPAGTDIFLSLFLYDALSRGGKIMADFAFLPFGGGPRKCVGDQFALMESTVALALLLQKFDVKLKGSPDEVEMVTGATLHTKNGLWCKIKRRTEST